MKKIRVALFACAYNEVDGVANTVRHFEQYAATQGLSLLVVHGGFHNSDLRMGTVRRVEFQRKFPKFPLDKKHDFDLLFWRYCKAAESVIEEFNPDLVHITGPSDVGMLGACLAHKLRLPLAASWHTNLHEYAERRALPLLRWFPANLREAFAGAIRKASLRMLARFYRVPGILFAPNMELMALLQTLTGKDCHLMPRGVDADLFFPREHSRTQAPFTIGYVGRITVEKNVQMLVELERLLLTSSTSSFRFLIVGQGAMEPWLKQQLAHAHFPGVLHGEQLAQAYASMDAFVFPSRTDTFGNVVLEALSSGVPAIVSDSGGPRSIVRHGETGFIARDLQDYFFFLSELIHDVPKRRLMGMAARNYAARQSWNSVFDSLYVQYSQMLTRTARSEDVAKLRQDFSTAGAAL